MLYVLIATLLFGLGMFVYAMFKDGRHGRIKRRGRNRALLELIHVRDGFFRMKFMNTLDDVWLAVFFIVCFTYLMALGSWFDDETDFLAFLVQDPGFRAAGIAGAVGLLLFRLNITSWYDYDAHAKTLYYRVRIRLPGSTFTWAVHPGAHHIAVRPPRFQVGRRREFRAVMVMESGKEIRIGYTFTPLWYDESLMEFRRHAETLGLTFVEPPEKERPGREERGG